MEEKLKTILDIRKDVFNLVLKLKSSLLGESFTNGLTAMYNSKNNRKTAGGYL